MSTIRANNWQSSTGVSYDKIIQHTSYSVAGMVTNISNPGGNYTSTTLSVTVTSRKANSRFFVMADCQGYISAGAANGWNIALVRNIAGTNTFLSGVNGTGGDSWMGFYHGSGLSTNSWSKCRTAVDSPGVPKGTSITYNVWLGGWTSTGTIYLGYDGYGDMGNRITVFELAG